MLRVRILADRCAQDWRPVPVANQVGLLFRSAFIHPLKPVVDGDNRAVWPDRPEERAMGNLFHPGVDGRGAVLGPVRAPAPTNQVGAQIFPLLVEECELRRRRRVVSLERLVAGIIEQCIRNAQCRDEVVNTAVLRKASAHGRVLLWWSQGRPKSKGFVANPRPAHAEQSSR
ncbi:hypothetical protein D3C73_902530 [compost metagenome]